MKIIDEVYPKIDSEVRVDRASKTLWVKVEDVKALEDIHRIIIEDDSNWCGVFYEGEE